MNKQEAILRLKAESWEYDDNCFRTAHVIDLDVAQEIISQIHKPQKPVVPKFVAEWIETARKQHLSLRQAMDHYMMNADVDKWFQYANNQDTFAKSWIDGYTVEQEKRYRIKIANNGSEPLKLKKIGARIFLVDEDCDDSFTKQEIEQAGFGWVFDCDGVEVKEVE